MGMHKLFVVAAAIASVSGLAQANNYQGTIANVTPYYGRVYISVMNGGGFSSGCYANATSMVYSFDSSTSAGKALLATALSAKLTDKVVYLYGDTTCPAGGNPYDGKGSENLVGMDLKG